MKYLKVGAFERPETNDSIRLNQPFVRTALTLDPLCADLLSIVPPKDAIPTAERILSVFKQAPNVRSAKRESLYYADLNAVSPATARTIGALFEEDQRVSCISFFIPSSPCISCICWTAHYESTHFSPGGTAYKSDVLYFALLTDVKTWVTIAYILMHTTGPIP